MLRGIGSALLFLIERPPIFSIVLTITLFVLGLIWNSLSTWWHLRRGDIPVPHHGYDEWR